MVPFADGHTRRLPRLTAGPFRHQTRADSFVKAARGYTRLPVKQAVISASLLSLLYPQDGIKGYTRAEFITDLVREAADTRGCLDAGACACWASSADHLRPGQTIFVGMIDPIDSRVETPEEVRNRVLEAAEFIPVAQPGTTDDCGFAPLR